MTKAESAYGFVALALLVLSLFTNGALDLVNGDIYFVIPYDQLLLLSSLPFVLFYLLLFCFRRMGKPLHPTLNKLHLASTVLLLIACFYWLCSHEMNSVTQAKEYSPLDDFQYPEDNNKAILKMRFILLSIIISQSIFVLNIAKTVLKKRI